MAETEPSPRDRALVALIAAAAAEPLDARVDDAASAALRDGALTTEELMEATLHFAVYAGWPRASHLEGVLMQQARRLQEEREEPVTPWPGLDEIAADPSTTGAARRAAGLTRFEQVNGFASPPCDTPYRQAVVEWVFGDLWWRPGLTRRDRRLISITCVALTGAPFPLAIHVGAAVWSGDVSADEMAGIAAVITPCCSPTRAAALTDAVAQATATP
ncbi:MAG: carboxymuconolactone decarboxylase [Actinobacteria bacterium]|nr:carboxymuconolactone decarboxylase [Actinomycetota bacterium]